MNILIVTHGPLATAMKESARLFYGDVVDEIGVLELHANDNPTDLAGKIEEQIVSSKQDTLVFVDIESGTPYNMTAIVIDGLKETYNIECLTGVNMPILLEALGMKDSMNVSEIVSLLETLASNSIVNLRKSLDI